MYIQICELELHHGVCLGTSYVNETVDKEMIHYIRAVASGPAGPALAGPLLVQETYFLKIEVGQFAHTSRLRGSNDNQTLQSSFGTLT